ncbi:MAG: glycoside hydrolase family 2 protein [Lentisphaeria bacterium]|jgi:beta-mannosidase
MPIVSLNGEWQLREHQGKASFPAQVPGDVMRDLLAAGRIEDPFFRENEKDVQWVGRTDWVYERTFPVDAALLERERVLLRCHGLDTIASISVNGTPVGAADNMFRTWEFDLKPALRRGANRIEVHFQAPAPYGEQKQKVSQKCGRAAWIRKEQCNFGWDWGPCLLTAGIWRDIELVAFDTARLADVHVTQDHRRKGRVRLNVAVAAEAAGAGAAELRADITVADGAEAVAVASGAFQDGRLTLPLEVKNPKLWWPNNLGAQPLYQVTVELKDAAGSVLDRRNVRLGLRTLRLDRHPDQWGESFQFVVNGVPFFAKGANWIPADAILSRLARADYFRLVGDAAAVHMNMLRCWGGGIYEDDAFYEACDEAGICVWQDCMFACAAYPAFDHAFMATVRAEIVDNARRLRHHPCLALWCGNNELEQGVVADQWNEWQMSWDDYQKLFDKLIPETLAALDPERDYWPSSPHSPHGDRREHWNPRCGDAHLWEVWHGLKPFEWYRTCEHRFNSEFGFQSFPEPRTVRAFTRPGDRNVTSYVMEHHQRSAIGNTTIMRYMLDWFKLPKDFENTLWLSQILQGMAMKYACEHWRRSMPRGMGTLYWQLNDCWPVASWASIDSFGRWKALQYMARQFFAPLLVSGLEDVAKKTVEVHVTSDLLKPVAGTVRWTVTQADGTVLEDGWKPVRMEASENRLATTLDLGKFAEGAAARNLLLWLELEVDGAVVAENFVSLVRPKHLELAAPGIRATVKRQKDGALAVTLKAAKPALWVWLEAGELDVRYSDNFFHLRPGRPVTVTVRSPAKLDAAAFGAGLKVRSLVDTFAAE